MTYFLGECIVYDIRLMIADRTPQECESLQDMICSGDMDIKISTVWGDGAEVLSQIQTQCPDVVLLEVELPRIDGLTVVSAARSKGYRCRFVLMNGQRNFDYVYTALRYHVDAYLLKPVQADEINTVLMGIFREIRQNSSPSLRLDEHHVEGRYVFITQVCADPSYSFQSLEEINAAYGTSFRAGLFCALFVKLDCPANIMSVYENSSFLHEQIETLIHRFLGGFCNDILFDRRSDGILFLVNYDVRHQKAFSDSMETFFAETKHLVASFPAFKVTLCIGREYKDLSHPYDVKNDALDARWLRLSLGTGQIIRRQDATSEDPFPLKNLSRQILRSCEILDVDAFRRSMDAFFNLPYSILGTRASRKFIRRIINLLLEMNNSLTAPAYDANSFKRELDYLLNMSVNFEQYHSTFCTHISKLMTQISENSGSQYTPPIRSAVNYIRLHYSEPISLQDAASQAELSPNYFSELFKKETGQNFSDYLTACRIGQAKKLLRESDCNISETAAQVGYSDVRYFGKLFKKKVGVTPGEYKRIHRA